MVRNLVWKICIFIFYWRYFALKRIKNSFSTIKKCTQIFENVFFLLLFSGPCGFVLFLKFMISTSILLWYSPVSFRVIINDHYKCFSKKSLLSDCNWTRTQNHLVRKQKLTFSELESSCSHLNFRFRACFDQGVPWHLGNYTVKIHSKTRTWHDKNIQSKVFIVWKFLKLNA